jgi:hypothetical protein
MSEQRDAESEVHDDVETEVEEDGSAAETEVETDDDEGEGDEERRPAQKPVDWEKRAHSVAGQAATERSRRRAAERRAEELESRLEKLERQSGGQDTDELLAVIAGLREDDEDPVGDIASVKRALKMFREREVMSAEQQRAIAQAERQVLVLKNTMADAEADFAAENPDYQDAANFYRKQRTEELQEAGYSGEELMHRLADDLFGLVRTAFSNGLDPAERVYNLAKKRGFKAGAKQADKKLDAFDRAGATNVRPRQGANGNMLSWADVAKLDGAARDKAWAKLREREKARKVQ